MDKIGKVINMIDQSLNTKERRHLVGGILMSVSMLFGGLSITVLSLRGDRTDNLEMIHSEEDGTYMIKSKKESYHV